MKRIGICSVHTVSNYGAVLQTLALKNTISAMGAEVDFVKIPDPILDNRFTDQEKLKSNRFINHYNCSYNDTNYDSIVIGSDELWNVANPSFTHHKEYLGYGFECNNIIAYAPSCNVTTKEQFQENYPNLDFSRFDKISVRDKNTQNLVKNISGKDVPIVLDPTFLLDSYDCYTKKIKEKDYILLYSFAFSEDAKNKIIRFSKKKNLKIYSIGTAFDWCDANLTGDITDFLGYMKNAKFVIAGTFHGIVFSIISKKQFVSFARGSHKLTDVLDRFNLSMRNDAENNEIEIEDIMNNEIDYKRINKMITKMKIDSLEYLRTSLGLEVDENKYEECI